MSYFKSYENSLEKYLQEVVRCNVNMTTRILSENFNVNYHHDYDHYSSQIARKCIKIDLPTYNNNIKMCPNFTSLLKWKEQNPFQKNLVKGDES